MTGIPQVFIMDFPGGSSEPYQHAGLSIHYGDGRAAELSLPVPTPAKDDDGSVPASGVYRDYLEEFIRVLQVAIEKNSIIAGRPR